MLRLKASSNKTQEKKKKNKLKCTLNTVYYDCTFASRDNQFCLWQILELDTIHRVLKETKLSKILKRKKKSEKQTEKNRKKNKNKITSTNQKRTEQEKTNETWPSLTMILVLKSNYYHLNVATYNHKIYTALALTYLWRPKIIILSGFISSNTTLKHNYCWTFILNVVGV